MSEARPCKFCGHVYVKPCDGEPSCPNFPCADERRRAAKDKAKTDE